MYPLWMFWLTVFKYYFANAQEDMSVLMNIVGWMSFQGFLTFHHAPVVLHPSHDGVYLEPVGVPVHTWAHVGLGGRRLKGSITLGGITPGKRDWEDGGGCKTNIYKHFCRVASEQWMVAVKGLCSLNVRITCLMIFQKRAFSLQRV